MEPTKYAWRIAAPVQSLLTEGEQCEDNEGWYFVDAVRATHG